MRELPEGSTVLADVVTRRTGIEFSGALNTPIAIPIHLLINLLDFLFVDRRAHGAQTISVNSVATQKNLEIMVTDDGRSFSPDHSGLEFVCSRALALQYGGELECIANDDNAEKTFRITLPLVA